MIEIGSLVDGKYKVINQIGKGGMSVVYLAMNERANKQWAIKEVRKDGVKDFDMIFQSLIAETNLLKKLSHPNLPSIIDVIEMQGTFLIVMDYIEGNPLSDTLEEFGAQPQLLVIEWAKQLCDVLEYIHTQDPPIIYRDMKPANIMLKPDGKVMLIDFGTAREFKNHRIADTTCLGTQGYAAPEQFGGLGQTDARTDIYCLGTTMYHLVSGHNPCEAPYEIYPIRHWNPSLSKGLENIILKCTARNPKDRYQSCAEVLYALEHYEEIDGAYLRRQKFKLATFMISFFCVIFSIITAAFGYSMYKKTQVADYNATINIAKYHVDLPEEKIAKYNEAIHIKPSNIEAYLGLLDVYLSDQLLSEAEYNQILTLETIEMDSKATPFLEHLKKNKEGYARFCFELGMDYWYYYEQEECKKKDAVIWFDKAINYGLSNKGNNNIAKLYSAIGTFHGNITDFQYKKIDTGKYREYWKVLESLKCEYRNSDNNEVEVVKIPFYQEVVQQIYLYAADFKSDGIQEKKLIETLDEINHDLEYLSTSRALEKDKNTLIEFVLETYKKVEYCYTQK